MKLLLHACPAVLLAGLMFLGSALPAQAQQEFPLKDGDTWVMVGDSITAQHLHSNYFEAYCFTRFPQWTIHFRNSGVSGDTIPKALARFDWDAAVWKPTVISVELGMNDAGGTDAPMFIRQMGTLTQRIRDIHARPVILSSSPVDDGSKAAKPAGRNERIDQFATSEKTFAAKENAPFADQFHALLGLWGENKLTEDTVRLAAQVKAHVAQPGFYRPDLLEAWLYEWNKSDLVKHGADLGGDGVHLGPPGQLTMCAALLQGLHAPGLVSNATINADGRLGEPPVGCQVTDVKPQDGGVRFTRLDQCLPMPIPDGARPVLVMMPSIVDLSQWMLGVTGLKPGEYDLTIDGTVVARFSAGALAKGVNLGVLDKGPVAEQCRQVLSLIAAKEGVVDQFRARAAAMVGTPPEAAKAALAPINEQVLAADAKIRAAAQPKPHVFIIAPAKRVAGSGR